MDNEIRIVIDDNTSNSKFSNADIEKKVQSAATQPKTDITKKIGGGGGTSKALGMTVANRATAGMAGKYASLGSVVTSPIAVATLALTMANKIYKEWQERNRHDVEYQATMLRAGGVNRGQGNLWNARTNMITGKSKGKETVYGGR